MASGAATTILSAVGTANMALQLNPKDESAHTAWSSMYKKHTHFATEFMELDQFYGLSADTFSSVDVSRIGDVCYEAYFCVTLPGIMNAFQPAAAGTSFSSTSSAYEILPASLRTGYVKAYASGQGQSALGPDASSPFFAHSLTARYCPLAPLALIKKISLQVGSAVVDTLDIRSRGKCQHRERARDAAHRRVIGPDSRRFGAMSAGL